MNAARANAAMVAERKRRKHRKHHTLKDMQVESSSEDSDSESSSEEVAPYCKTINDITKSNKFSLVVASMIMLNVVVMGLQANFEDFYLPLGCTTDTVGYRYALVQHIIEAKADHAKGRRLGPWQARLHPQHHDLHQHRRLADVEVAEAEVMEEVEAAAVPAAASGTVQLHTLAVDGFPDHNNSERSFLNGLYRERMAPQYRLGNHSTFWDLSGQRYIFYCPRMQSWGIGGISEWAQNTEGECVWGACTFPGVNILDPSTARFTRVFDGFKWRDINSAGVVQVQTEDITITPENKPGATSSLPQTATEPPATTTLTTTTTTGQFVALIEKVHDQMHSKNFSVNIIVAEYANEKGCMDVWVLANSFFLLFFVAELSFRLITYGSEFFTNEGDMWWNIFDLCIVLMGCVDALMRLISSGQTSSKLVMMVRVVRILRILRVLRLFKEFRKLTMLIRGLVESFTIVFWICALMMMFMIVYAIFCTTLVGHEADLYKDPEQVQMYFGSVYNSTVTLFQFLTLDDWSTITRMVWDRQPIMLPMFLIYIVVVSLVVVSLLTGVMAEHMNTVRESEEALEEQERQSKLKTATRTLYDAFKRVDEDKNKTINFSEFEKLVRDRELLEELKAIELDLGEFDPYELFLCFDQDFDDLLSWNEFRDGMEELRKPVGAKMIYRLQATMQRVVAHQVQAETCSPARSSAPGTSPQSSGSPNRQRTMSNNVNKTLDKVNSAMNGIEETLGDFEDDLKDFVSELKRRRHRGTL